MLKAIDDFLLDSLFQRLADWIADRYERTLFTTARILVYLDLLNVLVRNLAEYGLQANLLDFLLSTLYPFVLLVVISLEESRLGGSWRPGTMNSLRYRLRLIRYIYIVMVPLTLPLAIARLISGEVEVVYGTALIAGAVLITSATFFASCTPKPPKPKEETEELPADAVLDGA